MLKELPQGCDMSVAAFHPPKEFLIGMPIFDHDPFKLGGKALIILSISRSVISLLDDK